MSSQTFTTCVGGSSNEMPVMPEAAKIESAKDAGSPHTHAVWGRPRTPAGEDLQPSSGVAGVLLEALKGALEVVEP